MNTTATHTAAGTYYPNFPGATTIREARALVINGQSVSAVVDTDGGYSVFVGAQVVATGELNGTEGHLMVFFAEAALAATTEAPVSNEVQAIRTNGAALRTQADAVDVTTPVTKRGRVIPTTFPTHPVQYAAGLRRDADILEAWTDADEKSYKQYISEGLGDTNGYYAPITRTAWKSTS